MKKFPLSGFMTCQRGLGLSNFKTLMSSFTRQVLPVYNWLGLYCGISAIFLKLSASVVSKAFGLAFRSQRLLKADAKYFHFSIQQCSMNSQPLRRLGFIPINLPECLCDQKLFG